MYIFTTKLLGPEAEIEGVLDYGEKPSVDSRGEDRSFTIESITMNDKEFEVDCLNIKTLKQLEDEAFDDVTANQEPF